MELVIIELGKLMIEIEEKYPQLINCIGNLYLEENNCKNCKFIVECSIIKRELKNEDFKNGKYRRGFGKPRRDKKTELPE